MKYFLPLAFSFFLFVGCKDAQHEVYLNEIDELQNQLNEMDSLSRIHNLDTLGQITGNIRLVTLRVQNNYFPDSIDMEIAGMMNAYKMVRKKLESNSGNLAKVKVAIPEVQKTLEDLAHDIDNGVGEREKYNDHLNFERDKVNQIKELLDFYIKTKEEAMTLFAEVGPKVEAFSLELVAKRQSEQ